MTGPRAEPVRVLVVDDEAPARQRLVELLAQDPQVGIVREADGGRAAVRLIREEAPDLVFLDVQMPELDGLGVIAAIGATRMPLTVFVTAYAQHAIRAFDASALDYLLKPFSDERLEAALARAKARLDEASLRRFGQDVLRLLPGSMQEPTPGSMPGSMPGSGPDPGPAARYLDRLAVRSAGVIRFVPVNEIDWIGGAGAYVGLHVAGRELLHRVSLGGLAIRLDPRQFVRIHRSVLVNIDSVVRLEPGSHGEFELVLRDGEALRVSRTYRTELERRLGQPL